MERYSQNNEQDVICDFFKGYIGTFADFGSNEGILLSNTYQLALDAWQGLCVEPSGEAFRRLENNYKGNDRVQLFNFAVTGDFDGFLDFYESGSHITENDISLLSTVNEKELKRWEGTSNKFTKILVRGYPVNNILQDSGFKIIDFFSIDVEGSEVEVISQIDFGKYQTRLVCIEHNSNAQTLKEITDYCRQFGLTHELLKNAENIILSKN